MRRGKRFGRARGAHRDTYDIVVLGAGAGAKLIRGPAGGRSVAPGEKAGAASSLLETGPEFGGALGMAVLGSLGTAVHRNGIPDETRARPGRPWAARRPSPVNRRGERETPRRRQRGRRPPGDAVGGGRGAVVLLGAAGPAALSLRRVAVREEATAVERKRRPRPDPGRRPPPHERRRGNRDFPVPPAPSNGRAGCGWISRVRPVPPSGPTWRRSPPRPRPAPRGAPCRRPSGRRGPRRRPRHARPACRRC